MSTLMITALVLGALFIIIILVYVSQQVEYRKLEKARRKAELTERIRRCADLSEILPGQMMTPALKLMMSLVELKLSLRLQPMDPDNQALSERIEELEILIGQGDSITVRNPPQQILNENKAKEVRFLLEGLHGMISRAAKENLLSISEARHWVGEVRHMLVQLHIDFFTNIGVQLLQHDKPRQARLAFERAVQFLRKQTDQDRYRTELRTLAQHLAHASDLALEREPTVEKPDELTVGLSQEEIDDPWKKKQVYD
ncbi:hypothetical protein [Pseudomonas sp.]|uniref:hypothetical protein n=1 Tax=Pseudomonas sp. TaxID=306 RepID=UPI0019E08BE4|nr:hypothetical protein [Pseudomonas sp.]MBF0676533.1 hypothetical protein [Pseudomonas sp.]